jgi:hypothetical protein
MRWVVRHSVMMMGVLLWGMTQTAAAQWYEIAYRPYGVRYQTLQQGPFEVIFQEGRLAEAQQLAAVLETHYDSVRALVGVRRAFRIPVVLNDYRDRGNGLVSPMPYRQEIDAARLRGLALAPTAWSWLDAVGPHELVHAAHAEVTAGLGIGGVLRWIGPDWSRLLNLSVPPGFSEGVAVYYESQIEGGAGRLHFPFFTMEFRAAMASQRPWRLAQLLEASAYSWPFDRHYKGGGYLYAYLQTKGHADFFRRTTRWFHRMPLTGFGIALWYGSREFPASLGRQFRAEMHARIQAELSARAPFTAVEVVRSEPGLILRRPYWLDAQTLVVYAQGYRTRPGYYRIEVATGQIGPIRTFSATEDYRYAPTPDRKALLVARYVPDVFLAGQLTAEVYRLTMEGRLERLTRNGRVYAPVPAPDGSVWALQNVGSYNRWVQIKPDGRILPRGAFAEAFFLQLAPAPKGDRVAVLLHQQGRQGLFEAHVDSGGQVQLRPWLAFRQGAIYDMSWSDDGRWLLFTADPDSIPNVYALEVATGRVLRLTNVPFGALEPALSPDGQWLAFIHYRHERYELVRIPFVPEAASEVPSAWLESFALAEARLVGPASPPYAPEIRPYRPWAYLMRPRLVYPIFARAQKDPEGYGKGLGWGGGLGIAGTDPLKRWAYQVQGFYRQDRLWGDLWLTYGGLPFRPGLYLYDWPSTVLVRRQDGSLWRVGRARRGAALAANLPVLFESNVYNSWALLTLLGRYEQERLFAHAHPRRPTLLTDTRWMLEPIVTLGFRLQQNWRDLMPNQGVSWTTRALWDLSRSRLPAREAYMSRIYLYLPFFAWANIGLRLDAGLLWQNRGDIYALTSFLPRGEEEVYLGRGLFGRAGVLSVVPLWFVDNGFVLLPIYLEALYLYGFTESLQPLRATTQSSEPVFTAGGGIGLQCRLFSYVRLDLRWGAAYRIREGRWQMVWR